MTGDRSDDDSNGRQWVAIARRDARLCRGYRLHWLTLGVLGGAIASGTLMISLLSEALWTSGDFDGFVGLVTTNASWLYTSIFALVGLFVAYPGRDRLVSELAAEGHRLNRSTVVGLLVSRWLFAGGGLLGGFAVSFLIAFLAYDPVSVTEYVGFVLVTTLMALAYVSVGVGLSLAVRSDERFILSILAFYGFVAFLWDTTLVPTLLTIAMTGDPVGAIGTPPGWYDLLVTFSPGGAHETLSAAVLMGTGSTVDVVALAVLLGWLTLPPAFGGAVASRRG